jgi:hypothetical protein
VVVGDLAGGGALHRGEVAGETPNLAARLQGVAKVIRAIMLVDCDHTSSVPVQAFG